MQGQPRQRDRTERGALLLAALAGAAVLIASPGSALAAERLALLRLEERGEVTEINAATNVSYRDLDTYLRSRLEGKQILEVKVQLPRYGCRQIILVRSSE